MHQDNLICWIFLILKLYLKNLSYQFPDKFVVEPVLGEGSLEIDRYSNDVNLSEFIFGFRRFLICGRIWKYGVSFDSPSYDPELRLLKIGKQ